MSDKLTREDTKPVIVDGKVVEFTIKRSKWGQNRLIIMDGASGCCMGHFGLACGLTPAELGDKGFLSRFEEDYYNWFKDNTNDYSDILKATNYDIRETLNKTGYAVPRSELTLAVVNDSSSLERAEKEKAIQAIFKCNGITVHFED